MILQVCLKAFCAIHGITRARVRRLQQFVIRHGTSPKDQRGRHTNNAHRTPEPVIQLIQCHIKSLPLRQSHYSLRKNPNVYYLDGTIFQNVAHLYRLFLQQYQINVSEKIYRQVFSKYRIFFGLPRSDTCTTCDAYQNNLIQAHRRGDRVEESKLHAVHKQHLLLVEKYQKMKTMYAERAKKRKINFLCFDYMQNLPLPNLSAATLFYARQLWVYVFGIHNFHRHQVDMFVYSEVDGQKASSNVATLLFTYLKNFSEEDRKKPLVLLCDSCPGQNKNYVIVKFLYLIVHQLKICPQITVIFPVRGHSYMQCDADFALIGKKKKISPAETIHDWIDVIRNVRRNPSPFNVHEITYNDFFNFKDLDMFLKTPVPPMKIKKARMLAIDNKEICVKLRYGYSGHWTHVNIIPPHTRLPKELSLSKLYENALPISQAKLKDLKEITKFVTKEESVQYYENFFNTVQTAPEKKQTTKQPVQRKEKTPARYNSDIEEESEIDFELVEMDISDNSSGASDID